MSDRPLWTVEAMASAMQATRAGALPGSISGISIDSRTVKRGDAFFAITGDSRDGHEFVEPALKASLPWVPVLAWVAAALLLIATSRSR